MRLLRLLPFGLALLVAAQTEPPRIGHGKKDETEDVRLPSGRLQRDEIVKAEYQKSLADCRDLVKLTEDLQAELQKNTENVVSISAIKKTEEIEKLAKRIRGRLKQ